MLRMLYVAVVLMFVRTIGVVGPITPSTSASPASSAPNPLASSKCTDKPVDPGGSSVRLDPNGMTTIDPGCDRVERDAEVRVGEATIVSTAPTGKSGTPNDTSSATTGISGAPNDAPNVPTGTSAAGMVYVSTSLGCGPAATIAAGESFYVYIWADQSGAAELTYHRPDGSAVLWSDRLVAGQRVSIPVQILSSSPGGKRLLRLVMTGAKGQDFCGITIRSSGNVLCGWTDDIGGNCASIYENEMLVSCNDGREYHLNVNLPSQLSQAAGPPGSEAVQGTLPGSETEPGARMSGEASPSTQPGDETRPRAPLGGDSSSVSRLYAFWNPQGYWDANCGRYILTGYSSARYLGEFGRGVSCSTCPSSGSATGTINIWTSKGAYYGCEGNYRTGEAIHVSIRAGQSGNAVLFNYWSDGQVKQLDLGYLQAGVTYSINSNIAAPEGRQVLRVVMPDFWALDYCSYIVEGTRETRSYSGRLSAYHQVYDGCSYYSLLDCDGKEIVNVTPQSRNQMDSFVGKYVSVDTTIAECGGGIAGQPLYGPVVDRITTIADPCRRSLSCDAYRDYRVEVMPPEPVEGDSFIIHVSGVSSNICVPKGENYLILGNTILIDVDDTSCGAICSSVVTSWQFDILVRSAPAGSYDIRLRVTCQDERVDCPAKSVVVRGVPTPPPPPKETDLGFRPDPKGFGFKNRRIDRSQAMFEQLYGKERTTCPTAQKYYKNVYRTWADQYSCVGFSASSLFAYVGLAQPNAGPFAIGRYQRLVDESASRSLLDTIAYFSGAQLTDQYVDEYFGWQRSCKDAPGGEVDAIRQGLADNDPVILGLKFSGDSFHAVVPYRVVDVAGDQVDVYIYDNEVPRDERVLRFTRANGAWQWRYTFGGSIGTRTKTGGCADMYVVRLNRFVEPGEPLFDPCPPRSLVAKGSQRANRAEHADDQKMIARSNRLLFHATASQDAVVRSASGNRLGVTNGQIVSDVPGGIVLPSTLGDAATDQHLYLLPADDYQLETSGAGLDMPAFSFYADGKSADIEPELRGGGSLTGLAVKADLSSIDVPIPSQLYGLHTHFGRETGGASRLVDIDAVFVPAGDSLTVGFDGQRTIVGRSTTSASYRVSLGTADAADGRFLSDAIQLDDNETHYIEPLNWNGLERGGVRLSIDRGRDGSVDEERMLGISSMIRFYSVYLPALTIDAPSPVVMPDLVPYQPSGWAFPIVPSAVQGGFDVTPLVADRPTYIDVAVQNRGPGPADRDVVSDLYIDGRPVARAIANEGLAPGQWAALTDWETRLTAGWHTLRLVVDPFGVIPEQDESNNVWERSFYWQAP